MRKKKKLVIAGSYLIVVWFCAYLIIRRIFGIDRILHTPPSDFDMVAWPILMLLIFGRHYVISEFGIRAYYLGIRIRNVPWSDVGRLILFHQETARRKEKHSLHLVVEKQNCDPPFPDEGNAEDARAFFFLNPDAFRIALYHKDPQVPIDIIEQYHKIDDEYYWMRDE